MITIRRKNRYANVKFKDCIEDSSNKKVLDYLKDYLKNIETKISECENVIICGDVGVGKTMMTKALENELKEIDVCEELQTGDWDCEKKIFKTKEMKRKLNIEYLSCQNLIKALREHFSKEKKENMSYHYCDLLIVDEIGIQYGTENERIALNDLFNYRYENYKPTIIISNKELSRKKYQEDKGIDEIIGLRIVDRIDSGSSRYFYIESKSKRKNKEKKC